MVSIATLIILISFARSFALENVTIGSVGGGSTVSPAGSITTVNSSSSDVVQPRCEVTADDPFMSSTIRRLLKEEKVSLIEYRLRFANRTTKNPLAGDTLTAYKLDKWSRVTTSQGQTLLSLAFNYGVLSMATLTLGTQVLDVDLTDDPPGCIEAATEAEKIDAIKHLLVRDFDHARPLPTLVDEERVCHEVIFESDGYALFRDICYYPHPNTRVIIVDDNAANVWLTILYVLLFVVRYFLIFFGPCMFIDYVERMSSEQIPYVVALKDALVKTIFLATKKAAQPADNELPKYKKKVDLSSFKGFPKLQEMVSRNQSIVGRPVKVRFKQYDITVNYRRLLTENTVDVGLMQSLYAAIFQCDIRKIGPFQDCCHADMYAGCPCTATKSWIKFWRKVAKASMVVLVPVPYYIRLIVYYTCEHEEVTLRKSFIERAGLREKYETTSSLIHYLTPTHPFFICIYVVFFVTAVVLAVVPKKTKREGRLLRIIVGSFRDLRLLAWTETLSMVTANVIWPLKRFGMLGCFVGIVYWPVALPVTLIVAAVYAVPTLYLTVRMAFYSKSAIFERLRRRKKNKPYQINTKTDRDMHRFEAALLLERATPLGAADKTTSQDQLNDFALDDMDNVDKKSRYDTWKDTISYASSIVLYQTIRWRRLLAYVATAVLCIATLYGVMIILSEVVGCLVEIVVFTIMGVIVNAAALLKYVMLVLMIFVYCCDCFNNMEKKYIKLNKALFGEIKGRIKNLSEVTSQPSALQENCGFKSQEMSEQASYESPDDVADRPSNHWEINDLVLFVDSEDMPRVPKMLFDQVCQIRVAGVPGPVYRGLIEATQQLLKIIVFIVFVFIVVLTFGSVYKVSTTNQMLATMVGGFLPMMLKTFMAPPSPDIELGTVSFKSRLDEVIKNFFQSWPIYDLPFDIVTEEEEEAERRKNDGTSPPPPPPPFSTTPQPPPSAPDQMTSEPHRPSLGFGAFMVVGTADNDDPTGYAHHHNDSHVIIPMPPLYPAASNSGTSGERSPPEVTSKPEGNNNDENSRAPDAGAKTTRFADPISSDGSPQTEVDILVYLPDKYDETWLDEWSDIASLNR